MERSRIKESDDGESLAHLRKIIDKAKVAMLTTQTGEHQMRSRPLFTERMDDDGALWFIVNASSPKTGEIHAHGGRVCLTYVDLDNQNFASLTGTAHLVDDPKLKAALWGPMSEIWFPKGKNDPSASLLKVVPESGEYWDGPATAAGRLLAFAKAAVTGDTSGFGTQRKFKVR
jgi:general stress protein 26